MKIESNFSLSNDVTLFCGDCIDLLKQIPDKSTKLVVTSPPYNLNKSYESKTSMDDWIALQTSVLHECNRILTDDGSICWQVGNHVTKDKEIIPLDIPIYNICKKLGLKLNNRIVWHFEHGLHRKYSFSGRYETIMWFSKSRDHVFNLDPIRVKQKYPGKKKFKGPNKGQLSCNPLGKNPGDVWIIPNVKHNHPEKTDHPCQFPIELIERLVLSLTNESDLIVDPFMGAGSALCAAVLNKRKAAGSDNMQSYVDIAKNRILLANDGKLNFRPRNKEIYKNK